MNEGLISQVEALELDTAQLHVHIPEIREEAKAMIVERAHQPQGVDVL